MLKIKDDVTSKQLENFGFLYHDKENAQVVFYKTMTLVHSTIKILIEIFRDGIIDFQLPIGCFIKKEEINFKYYIQDLIDARLVEKVEE